MSVPTPYYSEANITLFCGDAREILPLLEPVDAVITDPPYGLGKRLSGGTWGAKFAGGLSWDQEIADFLPLVLSKAEISIIWGGNYYPLSPSRCWLVWYKPDAVRTMSNVELAWTNLNTNSDFISHSIAATNAERVDHPTQKPLRVMRWCVSKVNDARLILDPFAGSGTTLVAAKQLGKKAIGIEIDPAHCSTIVSRLRQSILPFPPTPALPVRQAGLFEETRSES